MKTLKKEICDQEEWKLMEDSALAKSCIVNDTDLSLLIAEELRLIFKLTAENEKLVARASHESVGRKEIKI